MLKKLLRTACLIMIIVLAFSAAAIPDSLLALSSNPDRIPSIVLIRTPDGDIQHITYSQTLIDAIDEAGVKVGELDQLSLPDDTVLNPGQRYDVTLSEFDQVSLTWSGYSLSTSVKFDTMESLLSRSGYSELDLSDGSRIESVQNLDSWTDNIALNYVNVDKNVTRKYEVIPHTTITQDDPDLYIGVNKVKVEGQDGQRALIFEDTYENGIFVGSVQTGTEVIVEPVQEVILKGIKPKYTYTLFNKSTLTGSVMNSLSKIQDYLKPQGSKSYSSYTDNGDGTITVDGQVFQYTSAKSHPITMYDGLEVCINKGCHSPAKNHNTYSGLPAQRGIVASYGVVQNGRIVGSVVPMGTILFIEGYGLGVVGDVNGAINNQGLIDLGYGPGETLNGTATIGRSSAQVYVLQLP